MRTNLKTTLAALAFGATLMPAVALAFPISAQLTGDSRPNIADDLVIDVDIVLIDPNTVEWTIDINSPAHPSARLDEFYFSVTGVAADYTFDSFNPANWTVASPATTAGGGNFNPTFLFEALDPPPPDNNNQITNSVNLVFRMNLVSGSFTDSMFLLATAPCSSELLLGCGQLGAHLISLTGTQTNPNTSGFLLGSYLEPSPRPVPEPGMLSLLGAMFLALGLVRRGRRRQ